MVIPATPGVPAALRRQGARHAHPGDARRRAAAAPRGAAGSRPCSTPRPTSSRSSGRPAPSRRARDGDGHRAGSNHQHKPNHQPRPAQPSAESGGPRASLAGHRPEPTPASRHPARLPQLRLRFGFVIIAMVLSVFGARLVQLQGVDPQSYAAMAAAEGTVNVDLPAERGDILDRNGEPLADSVDGMMVVADPPMTADEGARARQVPRQPARRRLLHDPQARCAPRTAGSQYVARRVPASKAESVLAEAKALGYEGLDTRRDPVRDYPAGDVAANLVGFLGRPTRRWPGSSAPSTTISPAPTARARYESAAATGSRSATAPSPRGRRRRTCRPPSTATCSGTPSGSCGRPSRTPAADSGFAVVMDTRTGELLALADYPTFDASNPLTVARRTTSVSRALSDVYEPGSVEKVLTLSRADRRRQGHRPHQDHRCPRGWPSERPGRSTTGSPTALITSRSPA